MLRFRGLHTTIANKRNQGKLITDIINNIPDPSLIIIITLPFVNIRCTVVIIIIIIIHLVYIKTSIRMYHNYCQAINITNFKYSNQHYSTAVIIIYSSSWRTEAIIIKLITITILYIIGINVQSDLLYSHTPSLSPGQDLGATLGQRWRFTSW